MFKTRKAHDPLEVLQDRVAHLEGLSAGLLQYASNRANLIRTLRDKTPSGTVERGLMDLLLTMEREAFCKTFSADVTDDQQDGHQSFVSVMSRSLRT
jgi:hypothetical protein